MDRQGREDGQVLVRIVVLLLSLAALAAAAGALPASRRVVLLAILRHAAAVACAFAARIHAPVDGRLWPASDEPEAAQLAKIFGALGRALAVPARQAVRAARWLVHRCFAFFLPEGPAVLDGIAPRPGFADTS